MKFTSKPKLIEAVRFLGAVFDPETGKATLHWAETVPEWLQYELDKPHAFGEIGHDNGILWLNGSAVGAGDWIVQIREDGTPKHLGRLIILAMTNAELMRRYEPRLETEAEEEKD